MAAKKEKVEEMPGTETTQEETPETPETLGESAQETPPASELETKEPVKISVKYRTLSSGPERTIYPGTVVEVSEEEAEELINGGYVDGV